MRTQEKETTLKLLLNYQKILNDDFNLFKVFKENQTTLKKIETELNDLNEIITTLKKELNK